MTSSILYIIAGANGSGKTTFALQFTEQNNLPFINADEIAKSINPGDLDKAKIKAGRVFFEELDAHLLLRKSFAIESTLSGHYLVKIIEKAKTLGYRIHIIYLYLNDPAINIDRVHARVLAGGHDIPELDIVRRFYRSKVLFWNSYRKLCDQWELFYNANENLQLVGVGIGVEYEVTNELLMNAFLKGVTDAR